MYNQVTTDVGSSINPLARTQLLQAHDVSVQLSNVAKQDMFSMSPAYALRVCEGEMARKGKLRCA